MSPKTYQGFTLPQLWEQSLTGKNRDAEILLWSVMRSIQSRRDAEADLIKETRKKHPGLARDEILSQYADWLDRTFPTMEDK